MSEQEPTYDDVTGEARDPRIAAAVSRLDGLGDRPVGEHVEVYEDVHAVLQESLAAAADESPGRTGESADATP